MTKSTYITPRLGRRAVVILGVWLMVNVGAASMLWSQHTPDEAVVRFRVIFWLIGVTYGYAAGLGWIATLASHTFSRFGVRLLVVAASACVLTLLASNSWLRHLSNLCGLLIFQTIGFFLLRVPDWQWATVDRPRDATSLPRRQFQIVDVIIATTSVALLLAVGIRYATPINATHYWLVMVLFWLVSPVIGASLFAASLAERFEKRLIMGIAAGILATTAAGALSFAQTLTAGSPSLDVSLRFYACILFGYFMTLLVVGIAGRIQSRATSP